MYYVIVWDGAIFKEFDHLAMLDPWVPPITGRLPLASCGYQDNKSTIFTKSTSFNGSSLLHGLTNQRQL